MTTISVRTLDESDPAALHRHYPGQEAPQTCFLALDAESGELSADWNGEVGNAVPASVYHGRTIRWRIPTLTAAAANRLLAEVTPLAQALLDDWPVVWNGSNMVGAASTEAGQDLVGEIGELCGGDHPRELAWRNEDLVTEADAADWCLSTAEAITSLGITTTTTDDELATIAKRLDAEAVEESDYGHTVLMGTLEYLTTCRDELREA
ncbi:hypothetical protein [Nocardia salmonicida]|uniref:hypothetical protein n=1 Tax=Nocardia salmonicida TaxID=53431 RepID=UPI0037A0B368